MLHVCSKCRVFFSKGICSSSNFECDRVIQIFFRPGSLAFDLTFFLYACTEQSERVRYWDEFIQLYHTAFTNTLQELGSDTNLLTKDALNTEIQNNAIFGVGMAMEAIVMSLMEDDEAADLDLLQVRFCSVMLLTTDLKVRVIFLLQITTDILYSRYG